ncbi:hypothetical protein PCE1_004929 [Barthelona sp. PCE]
MDADTVPTGQYAVLVMGNNDVYNNLTYCISSTLNLNDGKHQAFAEDWMNEIFVNPSCILDDYGNLRIFHEDGEILDSIMEKVERSVADMEQYMGVFVIIDASSPNLSALFTFLDSLDQRYGSVDHHVSNLFIPVYDELDHSAAINTAMLAEKKNAIVVPVSRNIHRISHLMCRIVTHVMVGFCYDNCSVKSIDDLREMMMAGSKNHRKEGDHSTTTNFLTCAYAPYTAEFDPALDDEHYEQYIPERCYDERNLMLNHCDAYSGYLFAQFLMLSGMCIPKYFSKGWAKCKGSREHYTISDHYINCFSATLHYIKSHPDADGAMFDYDRDGLLFTHNTGMAGLFLKLKDVTDDATGARLQAVVDAYAFFDIYTE